jgi:hypothetical protein
MVKMKRIILLLALGMVTVALSAQQLYNERVLLALGLDSDEIRQVVELSRESNEEVRRLQADLQVQKAELARLLLDDNPNMRQIERNLRGSADIEVRIRLVEIEREIAIREIVGTDRWARIVQTLRARQEEVSGEATERFRQLQQAIDEKQEALSNLMQERRDLLTDEEIRDAFRELQEQYQELQRTIREQM